jgi:hypothetical protein
VGLKWAEGSCICKFSNLESVTNVFTCDSSAVLLKPASWQYGQPDGEGVWLSLELVVSPPCSGSISHLSIKDCTGSDLIAIEKPRLREIKQLAQRNTALPRQGQIWYVAQSSHHLQ